MSRTTKLNAAAPGRTEFVDHTFDGPELYEIILFSEAMIAMRQIKTCKNEWTSSLQLIVVFIVSYRRVLERHCHVVLFVCVLFGGVADVY